MKNFDLEAAKRGAAVCTRSRMEVRIVCFDRVDLEYPILGLRKNKAGVEYIFSYTLDGFAFLEDIGGEEDLMMRDDDYLEKLERGEYDHIADVRKMVGPAIKQNLNTDRKYWLRVFAGQAMQGILASDVKHEYGLSSAVSVAAGFADALIAKMNEMDNYI
ncbi:hypothetical protein [uncultured Parabacteroides sp.]|uniref:hypothetical protein n=1 Tax=uncultured Parabacteroides sp. TaxID=512312 RepID=UPI002638DCAD|nr:hypothetical protein [uncultured Parabacteroides sp.]